MNTTQTYLSGAVMACFLGVFGLAHAQEVKPAAPAKADSTAAKPASSSTAAKPATASKPAAKAVKSTKSTKSTKSAKPSGDKTTQSTKSVKSTKPAPKVNTVAAPAPVTAAPAPKTARSANPYLAHQSANPYLPAQPANPYLAYRSTSTYAPAMPDLSPLMALLPADAQKAIKESRPAKVSLRPLPVDIFMVPNQKPTVAFTTPCAMVEKATNGFPVFTAMTNFMYTMAGNINESNTLPIIIEPVCV